jgi:hypothetical protein
MSARARKLAPVATIIIVSVAVFIIIIAVQSLGGPSEVLQLPAVVSPLTPAKQDGYTLVAVSRGKVDDSDFAMPGGSTMLLAAQQSSGDTILWIAPPILPPTRLLRATSIHDSGKLQSFYRITVVSSMGDHFRLPWHYEGGCLEGGGEPCIETRAASISPRIIAADIPAGYPSDISYFDVKITDPLHHLAHWRLSRLPKSVLVGDGALQPAASEDGVSIALSARRIRLANDTTDWPVVKLFMTIKALSPHARHKWALFQRREIQPSLSWQPVQLPWMRSTSDQGGRLSDSQYWLFSRSKTSTEEFTTIMTPYTRKNTTATFRGILSQYETRTDFIDLRDIKIERIYAMEAGLGTNTYCINIDHKLVVHSTSGLTFVLPRQRGSYISLSTMTPNSLNLIWRLKPLTPSHNDIAAMLPDSPLCRKYNVPAAVWFEASVDGKPLGVCAGLPDSSDTSAPITVHFPALIPLPAVVHDLRITIHQRVDLNRIGVTLTTPIKDEFK